MPYCSVGITGCTQSCHCYNSKLQDARFVGTLAHGFIFQRSSFMHVGILPTFQLGLHFLWVDAVAAATITGIQVGHFWCGHNYLVAMTTTAVHTILSQSLSSRWFKVCTQSLFPIEALQYKSLHYNTGRCIKIYCTSRRKYILRIPSCIH